MQPRAGTFTYGVEPVDGAFRIQVDLDAAAHIVGTGADRYVVFGDVDADAQAFLIDVREVPPGLFGILVRHVEADMIQSVNLHLVVDGPCHDVARGEGEAFVVLLHELLSVRQAQHAAVSAHRLGDEEGRMGLRRIVEDGGVELYELHVLHGSLGPVDHCDAVSCGDHRIGGHGIDGSHTACRHERDSAQERVDLPGLGVEDVCSVAFYVRCPARHLYAEVVLCDDFHGVMVLEHGDVAVVPHGFHQPALYLETGVVGMMEDAEVAVPALPVQVVVAVLVLVEVHTPSDERPDGVRGVADDVLHGRQVGNVVAGDHRVVDVLLEIVYGKVGYGCHASLCLGRVGFFQGGLAYKCDLSLAAFRHAQRIAHSCDTAADNEEVEFVYHNSLF